MRAPWSSSALAVNSFAPWAATRRSALAGLSGFTETLAFEAKCPNGVSRIPPHLDVLLERGDEIVAVESKCTEYLRAKTAKVAAAYLALAEKGDERARSRWFAALAEVPSFRLLDAYQLVKHYLGLTLTYPKRPLTLVYLYWEPTNADALPLFAQHREEVERFGESSPATTRAASRRSPTRALARTGRADGEATLARRAPGRAAPALRGRGLVGARDTSREASES